MPTPTFTLPQGFDPTEFLPPGLHRDADSARWLMHTITLKTLNDQLDEYGWARLCSRILQRVMGERTAKITHALADRGAIQRTASYCPGVKHKGYRLAARFVDGPFVRVRARDPYFIGRYDLAMQRLQKVEEHGWLPVHHALRYEQRRILTIDSDKAAKVLASLPEKSQAGQQVLVENLHENRFQFSVSSTGRVFNSITGMKRELRHAALRLDGRPVMAVDIVSAQPAFVVAILAPANGVQGPCRYIERPFAAPCLPSLGCLGKHPAKELDSIYEYSDLVFSGKFYEELQTATGIGDRDEVKRLFMRDILAKKGNYPSQFEDVFRERFPVVHACIRQFNKGNHAALINHLQRLESWLVVEQVAPRLLGHVPVVTLHDSIYTTADGIVAVEAAFDEVFDEQGFRLMLKREAMPT